MKVEKRKLYKYMLAFPPKVGKLYEEEKSGIR